LGTKVAAANAATPSFKNALLDFSAIENDFLQSYKKMCYWVE
jgi:hypothetical protein